MARITCRTPSTGKPLRLIYADVPNSFVTLAEAPDFSVPDASNKFETRDPDDTSRAIRPGEIFFLTPLAAKNKDTVTRTIEVNLLTEEGITIEFGKVEVPAGDTAFIPLQGRSIFKRSAVSSNGDRIRIKSELSGIFDVWAAGEEKLSSEHAGVV